MFLFCVSLLSLRAIVAISSPPDASWHRNGGILQQGLGGSKTAHFDARTSRQSPLNALENTLVRDNDIEEQSSISGIFSALLNALDVMQSHYFAVWQGTWPAAIDWTAAVMGTQVSTTLIAMTESRGHVKASAKPDQTLEETQWHENLINRYFTQTTAFYFGENAFSLRTQAYDDMLWVVLGWLESIKFINQHSDLQCEGPNDRDDNDDISSNASAWYGQQFIPQFAHRARLFYDLAYKGWDTSLCGGGMIWNPYLAPYKNAITNELFIAASISMYLYFPGDDNTSPFATNQETQKTALPPAKAHDVRYLEAAVEAYDWLSKSDMKNAQGLYVDGFHIRGWRGGSNGSTGTGNCDIRDEQVYTYNQGVLLSGLRGLWEATGSKHYLSEGYELIDNVITATGWHVMGNPARRWIWAGLGRNGVLEEACDSSGTCSQDGQTFKGIFFHHMTTFCAPLPRGENSLVRTSRAADDYLANLHWRRCEEYTSWIRHNAEAAYMTRDRNGEFGMWWGRPFRSLSEAGGDEEPRFETPESAGTDYRNTGVPRSGLWRLPEDPALNRESVEITMDENRRVGDLNDRGRGRTVETQSGGLAVVRALWRLVGMRED